MYNILLNLSVALPEKDAKEISDYIIKIYDTNHDGVVDFVEFMVVYLVMSKGSPDEILSTMFRVFDDDQNGKITIDEMRKLVESMYGMLVAENPELPDKRELARQMFREMDHNKDDVVTLEVYIDIICSVVFFVIPLSLLHRSLLLRVRASLSRAGCW